MLLTGGDEGTRKVEFGDVATSLVDNLNVINHRNIYRGKNLGTAITDEQLANIRNGSFDDLYVGDYWVDPNKEDCYWEIADIDLFYKVKTREINQKGSVFQHHLVIVPRYPLLKFQANTPETNGGYVNSYLNGAALLQAEKFVYGFFEEENVLSHDLYLSNAGIEWETGMVFEEVKLAIMNFLSVFGWNYTLGGHQESKAVDNSQFALFRLKPESICYLVPDAENTDARNSRYWLRNIFGEFCYLKVYSNNTVDTENEAKLEGIRPYFLVG